MDTQELAQAIEAAFAARDIDAVAGYLSDDFQFSGPTPEPVGKAMYVGLTKTLAAASISQPSPSRDAPAHQVPLIAPVILNDVSWNCWALADSQAVLWPA